LVSRVSDRADHHGLAARRLVVGAVAGAVALVAALFAGARWGVAVSVGWDSGALVFLVWVWASIGHRDAAATARLAQAEDVSRATADAMLLSASVASLVAVGLVLVEAGRTSGTANGLLIGLAVVSVALAWASVHTVFTLRYGHLYYYDSPPGGIDFNEEEPPDYRDFAYVALTVGMTFQVSDTNLTAKEIRRTATRHALLSFVFGAVVLAITINIVASLLNK
jgi:uncharacterized membrane protein